MIEVSVNEVATGVLTSAIGATARWLTAAATNPRVRRGEDLAIARWFETYKLTDRVPALPGISAESAERLAGILRGNDIQAALQTLLATRLTDAPNAEAERALEVFRLTLIRADPGMSAYAQPLADYFDLEICDLVGRLEGTDPAVLAQIRSEALSARMIAVLNAIERHTAALTAAPRDADMFLASYRRQVVDHHAKLEPPDFERRRRVPISDIYVPAVIYKDAYAERLAPTPHEDPPAASLWELAEDLDRSVLLGDPGGGKTTASNVLMHLFASDASRRVPFLVTLRNFAAEDPPARSVVGYIEHELETFYQCPAPAGLVDLLLLSGQAVVLFDGLDELLDTARRSDVASRVERFCAEYPLAPVLVTSRVVGYDQARLDDRQFTCYRLGGFRDEDVADYARKWFALDEGAQPDDANSFLAESESVPDLRTNPLLLSLMCILYRGEGSLPRNRAEVYEECANLLFRKWDARRKIHAELRAGHLVEPALRHLAWWLFTREDSQSAVTERELVIAATEFLHGRGFEFVDDAREAAREFIEFCRGRMWVFSDTGTTATGENLYSFTHRTFLEYFAAGHLAFHSDTPEKLARTLIPHVARGEWEVVGELSVQIKDSTSTEGARRIYETILDDRRRRAPKGRGNILHFLARTLRSVDPSPQVVRRLAREALDFMFSANTTGPIRFRPISWLMASCGTASMLVNDEISATIDAMIGSDDTKRHLDGLLLALWLDSGPRYGQSTSHDNQLIEFWHTHASENRAKHKSAIAAAASYNTEIRHGALRHRLLTVEQAIANSDDLRSLFLNQPTSIFPTTWVPYLSNMVQILISNPAHTQVIEDMTALGKHLSKHPAPPFIDRPADSYAHWDHPNHSNEGTPPFEPLTCLGAAAVILIPLEPTLTSPADRASQPPNGDSSWLGPFSDLYPYIERRRKPESVLLLPDLPVPEDFKQVFRDWAEGKINFVGPSSIADENGKRPATEHRMPGSRLPPAAGP